MNTSGVQLAAYEYCKAVIGCNVGEIMESVRRNESGITVDPNSVPSIKLGLIRMIESPEFVRQCGFNGRASLKDVDPDAFFQVFVDLLE
jgi:glycosyltransferase involved in cell wall biosynthesis